MNYALFAQWIRDRVEDLVGFGVPRDEAEHIMNYAEVAGIASEAESRREAQFLLDFKRNGSVRLAERHDCTPQNMRKMRLRILKKRTQRLRARLPS